MALTNTDKTEIERIARAEIKEYLKKTLFEFSFVKIIEINKINTKEIILKVLISTETKIFCKKIDTSNQ